jgi:hypothetical protein
MWHLKRFKVKLRRLHILGEPPKPDEETQKAAVTNLPALEHEKDHTVVSVAGVDEAKSGESTIAQTATASKDTPRGLYVYCIVPSTAPKDYGKIAVEGNGSVYAVEYKDIAAVVSEFPGNKFEKTDANMLAHQRVVQKAFETQMGIPIQFGTIAASEEDVRRLLEEGYERYKEQIAKLSSTSPDSIAAEESSEPTDVIAEVLAQSAASAVRIRQLTDNLDSVRRREYEKGAERMVDGAAKRLLDFLARAPAGTVQVSEASSGASSQQMQRIEQRLDALTDQLAYVAKKISEQGADDAEALRKNQEKMQEKITMLATQYENGMLAVEKTVRGTLRDCLETVPPAIEAFVLKAVRDAAVGQRPSGQPAFQPSVGRGVSSYTVCAWCGIEIPKTDKFCDRCGNPNTYLEGMVS